MRASVQWCILILMKASNLGSIPIQLCGYVNWNLVANVMSYSVI
jgi:hypothetical protein